MATWTRVVVGSGLVLALSGIARAEGPGEETKAPPVKLSTVEEAMIYWDTKRHIDQINSFVDNLRANGVAVNPEMDSPMVVAFDTLLGYNHRLQILERDLKDRATRHSLQQLCYRVGSLGLMAFLLFMAGWVLTILIRVGINETQLDAPWRVWLVFGWVCCGLALWAEFFRPLPDDLAAMKRMGASVRVTLPRALQENVLHEINLLRKDVDTLKTPPTPNATEVKE